MGFVRAFFGLLFIIGVAWVFSSNKKSINWRLVVGGLLLQITFGFLITQVEFIGVGFSFASKFFVKVIDFTNEGTSFLFGDLLNTEKYGFIFAINVLPTIIFFSTLSAGLYYLGVLQKIVYGFAWIMSKTMKLSGAESLSAAGNIFLGQTEAPLLVRPFISDMTKSEIMCLMTGGMATIAGGVLAGYVAFLGGGDPAEQIKYATFLLTASVMNAPAAIVMAKLLVPETEYDKLNHELKISSEKSGVNLIDALARGAADGLKLALNVGAMLLAFIAVIAALNYVLKDVIGDLTGLNTIVAEYTNGIFDGFSLQFLLGNIFRVFAYMMGVDWSEALQVGSLLGQKTVINEFVAYLDLASMKASGILNDKSLIIATFSLCGFSNFSSIAIQIGGIGGMAPNRQGDISKMGLRALLGASLATMLTGTLAGALLG
ncbi:MAG: NupC/NupG family nucleoside CNT transporter [Cyclobacteriaceae bacterium]|nr:NupC/NupG family nucleoside CNT transporter [Cyclobacteriaceae bacterium]